MGHWETAADALLAKLVSELAFEQALRPEPVRSGRHQAAVGAARYEFAGVPGRMGSLRVAPGSVTRDGLPTDPFALLLDLHAAWGLEPATTALTVAELQATLAADAHLLATGLPVEALAELPHAELEGHQTGHPWIVANKGRVGFTAPDAAAYAPEHRVRRRLPWIAAHRSIASHHGAVVTAHELPAETHRAFQSKAHPDVYTWLPIHPWQWDNVVGTLFADELAAGRIVPLGEGTDSYLPQQSIRTFTNVSRPAGFDVKLSLSVLNTMVYRGIPTELAVAAPPTTAWLHALRDGDPFLRELILPGEVAAVAVAHPVLESIPGAPYRYRQLLGALWREPVAALLRPGERARTLAALLHVDGSGRPFVGELVRRSGLVPDDWLARLLHALLPPLLHLLYRYGLAVNPHGENTTIVYSGDVPVRIAVKDFVDDLKLLEDDLPEYAGLPREALGVLMRCPADELTGAIVKALFVGHFRYLAPLCAEHLGVPEDRFWALVLAEVTAYQGRFPELAERFARFDLLAPTFERVCLNRERLLPGGYHDRPARDASFHLDAAPIANPLLPPGRVAP